MAGYTLEQAAKLSKNTLQTGVVETLATESKILALLPFMNVEGKSYDYNVETKLSGAHFRAVGEGFSGEDEEFELGSEKLYRLIDEAFLDSFEIDTMSDTTDLMELRVKLKAKAIAELYEKTFVKGDSAINPKEFDGLIKRVKSNKTFEATGDILNDIDLIIDEVSGGADAIIMNKATKRKLTAAGRKLLTVTTNEFGKKFTNYGDAAIVDVPADYLEDGTIIGVRFGVEEAVCGLQHKNGVKHVKIGTTESEAGEKVRLEWYAGMAVFNPNTVAMLVPSV